MKNLSRHDALARNLTGIVGRRIASNLVLESDAANYFPQPLNVKFSVYNELVVRHFRRMKEDGAKDMDRRMIDAVMIVEPGKRALCQDWVFTIGFEVKVSSFDLWQDKKIHMYKGFTNYFLLAVPNELIEEALKKAKQLPGVGVVSLDTGIIAKMPEWQNVTDKRRYEVAIQALCHHHLCHNSFEL